MDINCVQFNENEVEQSLCVAFGRDGVSLERVDTNRDGAASVEEMFDFAFSQGEYHRLLEGSLGRPIPWVITDEKIQEKIAGSISELKKIITAGNEEGGPEYKRLMAIGLYYFAYFPDAKHIAALDTDNLRDLSAELEREGLSGYMDNLKSHGGLGIYNFGSRDAPLEATATEALQNGYGLCTERSNILFALYSEAGLDPFFVYMRGIDIDRIFASFWDVRGYFKKPYSVNEDHVAVGITVDGKKAYFDLTVRWPQAMAPYSDSDVLSLSRREFFILTASNGIGELLGSNRAEEAKAQYSAMKKMGRHPVPSREMLMDAHFTNDTKEQLELLKKAAAADRTDVRGLLTLAGAYASIGDHAAAIPVLEEALRLDPYAEETLELLGRAYLNTGRNGPSYDTFKRLIEVSPNNAFAHLASGNYLFNSFNDTEAEKEFKRAFSLDPVGPVQAAAQLGRLYQRRGDIAGSLLWHRIGVSDLLVSGGEPKIADLRLNQRISVFNMELEAGRISEAELQLKKISDEFPNYKWQLLLSAKLKARQKRWAEVVEAVDEWKEANAMTKSLGYITLKMPPTIPMLVQFLYFDAKWHLNDHEAVALWTSNFAGYNAESVLSEEEGEWAGSVQALDDAIKAASPEFIQDKNVKETMTASYVKIAELYEQRSKWREVIGIYQRVLKFAPDYAPAYGKIREGYFALGFNKEIL